MGSSVVTAGVCLAASIALASCGFSDDGGGGGRGAQLQFWSYNEPGGSFKEAADRCTQQSNGRYSISFQALGNDPNTQRQQLVRRLAAGDSSIDLMSMDVIWTAEFAEAGWIKPFPEDARRRIARGTLEGPLRTATYQDKLYGAPANSNTQLLWYRKDKVDSPPRTWDQMIDMAVEMKTGIEVQGADYEGYMVWFNSLVSSAGGSVLEGPEKVALQAEPTRRALEVIEKLARSSAANTSINTQKEDQNRLAFEEGNAAFQINYPFIYSSARDNKVPIFEDIAWAPWPRVDPDKPARAPIGGFNWGVGAYTEHPEEAFAAAECLRSAENQIGFATKGGLPPTLERLYDDKELEEAYPFGKLIRRQLDNAGVRPVTPAYATLSQGITSALSPPNSVTPDLVDQLRTRAQDALESKGIF